MQRGDNFHKGGYKRPHTGGGGGGGDDFRRGVAPRTEAVGGGEGEAPRPTLRHPFKANFNDHFETSVEALHHVLPAVQELRQLTRPSAPELFTIYDPYYCSGTVATHWAALGIEKVLHENRDFYADIAAGTVPGPYDMVVTNPPFSDDHILRMMNFLIAQDKPWAFLAPDYIATKPWYQAFVKKHFTPAPPTGKGNIHAPKGYKLAVPAAALTLPPFLQAQAQLAAPSTEEGPSSTPSTEEATEVVVETTKASAPATVVGPEPFYIIPKEKYDFRHPTGAGKDHSHFKSMWYVWLGRRTADVMRGTKVALLKTNAEAATQQFRSSAPEVVHGLVALVEGKHVRPTEVRQNPQRRTRADPRQQQQQRRWK